WVQAAVQKIARHPVRHKTREVPSTVGVARVSNLKFPFSSRELNQSNRLRAFLIPSGTVFHHVWAMFQGVSTKVAITIRIHHNLDVIPFTGRSHLGQARWIGARHALHYSCQ